MAKKGLRGRIGVLSARFREEDGFFFLAEGFKVMLVAVLVVFTLCSLLSVGARFSRSSFLEMAMDQYLLHKIDPTSAQGLALALVVSEHAKVAATRELLFLTISLLTSWTTSMAAYYFLFAASLDETEPDPCGEDGRGFSPLSAAAALIFLEVAGNSAAFLAAAVLVASVFRFLSFTVGTVLGQALAMSALDDEECGGGMEALRRPVRLLLGGSPAMDLELLLV
ncbi:unnamed protein product [Spirodela intermedia]|uniref:Uncharacterized protein n=1 Tax=Spirodela intermedia TaxID=51605 RepID=A0A7I8JLS2_SPIIN|nr:unnamed protein product [Spirodela intermedia]CAA6671040.1 unnamed protein product [Spirodela intermedia]